MGDDWLGDDPFAAGDPEAAERERRRREREEQRQRREESREPQSEPKGPAPEPERRSRPPEAEFWDEPLAEASAAPPGGGSVGGERRRLALVVAIGVALLLLASVAAVAAYRQFGGDEEPAPQPVLKAITLTVPEGYSREQTAELAREAGLRGDYLEASVRSPYLNPGRYGGKGATSLEGFLFPDTFELEKRAPATDLVQRQLEDFQQRIAGVDMRYARSKNLTTFDVLTIASMVEEEAQVEGERPLVAAVIYNRLREGMPLGIDATTRFATGNYERPLTESELADDSPYNTRVNAGLPPGPISSPGLASIEAAARPAKVDYLFYVVEPGTCGKHAFSASEAEFEADVARYEEARAAAGGESPDTCAE